MLYALLLLGLLPAAFMIDTSAGSDGAADDGDGSGDDDPGADLGGVPPGLDLTAGTPTDSAPPVADGDGPAQDGHAPDDDSHDPATDADDDGDGDDLPEDGDSPGATLEVPADSGDAVISGFRPGLDSINLHLRGPQAGFYMTQDADTGDSVLHVEEEDGERLLTFEDLAAVPLGDISVAVTDPETGGVTLFALRVPDGGDTVEMTPAEDVLDPQDPAQPDDVVPADDSDPAPLQPVDPELPDPVVPADPDADGPVLEPIDDIYDDLDTQSGDGLLDRLIDSESDAFGPASDPPGEVLEGGDQDDVLEAPAGGGDAIGYVAGTPQLGPGAPLVAAGGGDDSVTSHGGAYVFGGDGDDLLADDGGGSALFGGGGNDILRAGPGGSYLDGGDGDDRILGGPGDDVIEGGEHLGGPGGDDIIDGGGGDDVIRGGGGADILSGGDGNDVIDHMGRAEERVGAEERLFAWHQDGAVDRLDGGDGDDTLIFGDGDIAHGGEGADQFHLYSGASSPAVIDDFTPGSDFLRITLDPAQHLAVPPVEVVPSADGFDGVVKVDGVVVAILEGTPWATTEDIYVEVLPDIAA